MTTEALRTKWIQQSLAGDLTAFSHLLEQPDLVLQEGQTGARDHVLTASGVREVLTALQRNAADPDLVQHWASFMRRGYIENQHRGPIQPVDIRPEPALESAISDILSRLDELGDTVDGEIGPDEVAEMLATLTPR